MEPQFCLPFLNKLLGKQNSLDDLKNLDPEFYRNLMTLRHLSTQETKDLGLTLELHDSTTAEFTFCVQGECYPIHPFDSPSEDEYSGCTSNIGIPTWLPGHHPVSMSPTHLGL